MNSLKNILHNYVTSLKKPFSSIKFMKSVLEPSFKNLGYRDYKDHKKILIIHNSRIGDYILMTTVFKRIRNLYPQSYIRLVCNECVRALNKYLSKFMDITYFNFDKEEFNIKEIVNFAAMLAKNKYDDCYIFQANEVSMSLGYFSGSCKIHIIYPLADTECKLIELADTLGGDINTLAMVDMYNSILKPQPTTNELEYWILDPEEAAYRSNTLISVCSGGSVYWKHIPPNTLAMSILLIHKINPSLRFQLLGYGSKEFSETEEIINTVLKYNPNIQIESYVNKVDLYETCLLISYSSLLICNDSSVAHMADASNTPTIVTYSCTKGCYINWTPYFNKNAKVLLPKTNSKVCEKCKRTSEDYYKCISTISPTDIVNAYKELFPISNSNTN